MLTCKVGTTIINCFDGKYDKFTLKQWSEKNKLICPDCGKPYEYCHGRVVIPYFRHKDKDECERLYSEPETQEHLKGKLILYNWLKGLEEKNIVADVKLEGFIPETKQHPDLYFTMNGKRCVFEFQCSPLATKFLERHELYKLAGVNDIWIMGLDKYNIQIDGHQTKHNDRYKTIEKYSSLYLNVDTQYLCYNGKQLANNILDDNYIRNRYYADNLNCFTLEDNNIIPNNKLMNWFIRQNEKDYRHYIRRKYRIKTLGASKYFIRQETHLALEKLNILFDSSDITLEYYEKESKYYICSIKVKYFDNQYIFYIKSDKIDFCRYTWYSSTLDSFDKRKINNLSIYYYVKKKINDLIQQEKLEQYKLKNTLIKIVDGNFNINTDYKLCNNLITNTNSFIDEIKSVIRNINKDIIYVLYNKTIYGQSISERNRINIITSLREKGLSNIEFYKEEAYF